MNDRKLVRLILFGVVSTILVGRFGNSKSRCAVPASLIDFKLFRWNGAFAGVRCVFLTGDGSGSGEQGVMSTTDAVTCCKDSYDDPVGEVTAESCCLVGDPSSTTGESGLAMVIAGGGVLRAPLKAGSDERVVIDPLLPADVVLLTDE